MSFLSDRRRNAGSANDKFSAISVLRANEPRAQGVRDALGGDERAKDVDEYARSTLSPEKRKDVAAKLNGDPDDAMATVAELSSG